MTRTTISPSRQGVQVIFQLGLASYLSNMQEARLQVQAYHSKLPCSPQETRKLRVQVVPPVRPDLWYFARDCVLLRRETRTPYFMLCPRHGPCSPLVSP